MSSIQLLNPLTLPNWDELVVAHPSATVFHSSGWGRVLQESYGFTPLYFVARKRGRLEIVLPLMEVDSPWTGRRGVSLPFTDYIDPILPGEEALPEVFGQVLTLGRERGWDYLELRLSDRKDRQEEGRWKREDGRKKPLSDPWRSALWPPRSAQLLPSSLFHLPSSISLPPPYAHYYGHLLDLDGEEAALKKNSAAVPCATSTKRSLRAWRPRSRLRRRDWPSSSVSTA